MTTPKPIPLDKYLGVHTFAREGAETLHRTLTKPSSKYLGQSMAEDFNAMFSTINFPAPDVKDKLHLGRLQGYMTEVCNAMALAHGLLNELGFEFRTTFQDSSYQLKISKKGTK